MRLEGGRIVEPWCLALCFVNFSSIHVLRVCYVAQDFLKVCNPSLLQVFTPLRQKLPLSCFSYFSVVLFLML